MHFVDIIDDAMRRDGHVITFAMRPGYRHRAKRDWGRTRESDIIPRLWHGMRIVISPGKMKSILSSLESSRNEVEGEHMARTNRPFPRRGRPQDDNAASRSLEGSLV